MMTRAVNHDKANVTSSTKKSARTVAIQGKSVGAVMHTLAIDGKPKSRFEHL